jgi:hypothetical protein
MLAFFKVTMQSVSKLPLVSCGLSGQLQFRSLDSNMTAARGSIRPISTQYQTQNRSISFNRQKAVVLPNPGLAESTFKLIHRGLRPLAWVNCAATTAKLKNPLHYRQLFGRQRARDTSLLHQKDADSAGASKYSIQLVIISSSLLSPQRTV